MQPKNICLYIIIMWWKEHGKMIILHQNKNNKKKQENKKKWSGRISWVKDSDFNVSFLQRFRSVCEFMKSSMIWHCLPTNCARAIILSSEQCEEISNSKREQTIISSSFKMLLNLDIFLSLSFAYIYQRAWRGACLIIFYPHLFYFLRKTRTSPSNIMLFSLLLLSIILSVCLSFQFAVFLFLSLFLISWIFFMDFLLKQNAFVLQWVESFSL